MVYALAIAAVIAVIVVIVSVVGSDRYSKMSDAEFEAEAQRGSAMGGAMLEIQNILDPQRKVEYILQHDKHLEADSSESGDVNPKPRP